MIYQRGLIKEEWFIRGLVKEMWFIRGTWSKRSDIRSVQRQRDIIYQSGLVKEEWFIRGDWSKSQKGLIKEEWIIRGGGGWSNRCDLSEETGKGRVIYKNHLIREEWFIGRDWSMGMIYERKVMHQKTVICQRKDHQRRHQANEEWFINLRDWSEGVSIYQRRLFQGECFIRGMWFITVLTGSLIKGKRVASGVIRKKWLMREIWLPDYWEVNLLHHVKSWSSSSSFFKCLEIS